jgi:hypothetical protein
MMFQLLLAVLAGGLSFVVAGAFFVPFVAWGLFEAEAALATMMGCAAGNFLGWMILGACGVSP